MSEHVDRVLERLTRLHPKVIDLELGRTERLLAALGHPERHLPPVIHVAGTNGKGSTVAMLRAGLESTGARVHVYTSPHLARFNERIRIAGDLISEERLLTALERCEDANGGAPDHLLRGDDGRRLSHDGGDAGRLDLARGGPRR